MQFKKVLLIIFLVGFVTPVLFSQNSWAVLIPETGKAEKMIKTTDGNYVMFFLDYYDNYVKVYKYNLLGEQIWVSEHEFFYAIDIAELKSGDIVLCGSKKNYPYLLILNGEGELKIEKHLYDFKKNTSISTVVESRYGELYAPIIGTFSEFKGYLYSFDLQGNIMKVDSSIIIGPTENFVRTSTGYLIADYYPNNYTYSLFDDDMNLIEKKIYSFTPHLMKKTKGGYIVHDYYNSYTNDVGLVRLDENLDSLWSVPFSHYYTLDFRISKPDDMAVCSDGGFIMAGSYSSDYVYRTATYLIKTDSLGNPEYFRDFWKFSPEFTINIVEANDGGFVLFQEFADEEGRYNFLVHTNLDGTVDVGESKYNTADKLLIYPNPATEIINFELNSVTPETLVINIYNVNGTKVKSVSHVKTEQNSVDVPILKNGLYLLEVIGQNKITYGKFLKQ